MSDSTRLTPAKREQQAEHHKRLARALRDNLHRRKQQARARQDPAARPGPEKQGEDPAA